ncbi:hypothetical protein GVAV_000870 [Gurleya vavrai]
MQNTKIDQKQIEQECLKAINKNDIPTFNKHFILLGSFNNSLILSYRLLYLLLTNKEEFYFLTQKISEIDDEPFKFVFDIERCVISGSKKGLCKFKDEKQEFSFIIDLLIKKMDDYKEFCEHEKIKKQKNAEIIANCAYILEKYDQI